MQDNYFELLTEEELEINKRVHECTTMEELQQLADELALLNENTPTVQYKEIDMPIEEFKKKYDLVDIKDLAGKYGF